MTELAEQTERELRLHDEVKWVSNRKDRVTVCVAAGTYGAPSTKTIADVVEIVGEHGEVGCSQSHEVEIQFGDGIHP